MDLYTLEKAAQVVFEMCVQHPEICLHDYELKFIRHGEGVKEEHYTCNLCGDELVRIVKE